MQKIWLSIGLLAHVATCSGMLSPNERFFVEKLMPAADEVDRIFSGKKGGEVFATNAPIAFKKGIKTAVDKFVTSMDSAPGSRLRAELAKLKTDGVLSNWQQAVDVGWVTTDPKEVSSDQKKYVGNIMTIYSGNTKRVLGSKVSRLIEDDYLILQEFAKKIDGLFASSKFGLNADSDTKNSIRAAVDSFIATCKTYKGVAEEPLKKLIKSELFALWDMATNGTGWLTVERDGWKSWKNEKNKAEAYRAVNNGIPRIMTLYGKDKNLLTTELNKIFLLVRDVLVGKARLVEIAQERKDSAAGADLLTEDIAAVEDKILQRAEILDNELGVITMNASQAQREVAAAAVNKFIAACKQFTSDVVDSAAIVALAEHPIILSWLKTQAINSWWVNKDFDAWKKNHSADYKRFSKESDGFMRAYAKSKKAMQNAVKSIVDKAKAAMGPGKAKELDKEEERVLSADQGLLEKLARWDVPAFKLPDIKAELLPESKTEPEPGERTPGRGESLGGETEEREARERQLLSKIPAVDTFARALQGLTVEKA